MYKRFLILLLSSIACLTLAWGFGGCASNNSGNSSSSRLSSNSTIPFSTMQTSNESSFTQSEQGATSQPSQEFKPSYSSEITSSLEESCIVSSCSSSIANTIKLTIKLNNGTQDLVYFVEQGVNISSYEPRDFNYLNKMFMGWYCKGEMFDFNCCAIDDLVIEAIWANPAPLPTSSNSSSSIPSGESSSFSTSSGISDISSSSKDFSEVSSKGKTI